jgi:ribosomal protein S18 acetylase RimI-like enzyme
MCNLFKPQSSTTATWHVLSDEEVNALFRAAGITCFEARDDFFWFPDENTWIKWLQEALSSAPPYQSITSTQRGFDCDKFARHFCDYVATKYLANGCFEVWGTANLSGTWGGHGWNVILTPNGLVEVEPQEASMWSAGTNPNYQIKTVYHAD